MMLSQKLTRIVLKMSDFQEYERVKEKRKREDKATNTSGSFRIEEPLEGSTHAKTTPARSSTPEHQHTST